MVSNGFKWFQMVSNGFNFQLFVTTFNNFNNFHMLNWILDKFVGDYNSKQLKKIQPLIGQINEWYERFDSLSDQEIKDKTEEFKLRIAN